VNLFSKILINYWGFNTKMWIKYFNQVARSYNLNGFNKLMDIFEEDYNLVAIIKKYY